MWKVEVAHQVCLKYDKYCVNLGAELVYRKLNFKN